jgi:hypothetical protein
MCGKNPFCTNEDYEFCVDCYCAYMKEKDQLYIINKKKTPYKVRP